MKKYFEEIEDTRQPWKIKYNLVEVIVMTIVAVTAGAEHWNEIAMYCKSKEDIFRKKYHLILENGVPTDDTFQRIFAIIQPEQLEKCFVNWVKSVNDISENEIVSIDGKTICGSRDDNYSVIHMISAWTNKTGIVLGQMRVDEKSNEIPAVPQLLDFIDVQNCTITSDATSCQKKTVQKIREKNCEYAICLKGNQETIYDDVRFYFESAEKEPEFYALDKTETHDKGHGRIEKRQYFLETKVDWLEDREAWSGLNAIGMVKSARIVNGAKSIENRYFITSLTDVTQFAEAVRTHWGIENSLHWCLDVNFDEDRCRVRKDNSGENLAVIRHIALNLYKSYQVVKLSMKAKRFRCSFDDDFLYNVIFNKFF